MFSTGLPSVHFHRCLFFYSGAHITLKTELIERIQHKFTRIIPEIKDLPYMERLHQLNLWTLEERTRYRFNWSLQNNTWSYYSVKFASFFEFENYSRTRGHIYKVKEESFQQASASPFFTERIINIWNSLDEQTVTASTLNCFKRNLEYLRNSTKMSNMDRCRKTLGADLSYPAS